VTALQQILISGGYLSVSAPTGYFGLGTQAAVEAYQAAHGISPASGYVGPLTRASLSAGAVQTGGQTIDRAALLLQVADLLKQVADLQAALARMQQ
jgi:peptidoglycan hydrolase-like protein with peptidoglycan-binding domain